MERRAKQKKSIQQPQYTVGDREKLVKLFELLIQIDKSVNKKKND
jgi:hypothetical protein